MDYIYDIVLNFNDDYYEFYEWKQEDKIINIKKIPIYKIPTNKYLDITTISVEKIINCINSNIIFIVYLLLLIQYTQFHAIYIYKLQV